MTAELIHTDAAGLVEQQGSDVFRLLVEGVRDYAIFLLDPLGYVVSWNAGAQRIKGYRADEIIGCHFSTFYTPEALATDWPTEELRRAREAGRFEDEGWRVRKDGTRFWANVIITALRDADGRMLGFSKITRDLTERRQNEERLRQSEERFRLLVEGVKDHAIFLLDADGKVLSWNAGAQRVLGYAKDEVLGRNLMLFYPDEDVSAGKPSTELAIARNAGFSEDTGWRVRADGVYLWCDMTLTALRERDNSLQGFALIIRDMSERRRMQQLEREGRRINEFIAMLAHELRNPLAPIGNAVGIMEKVAATPELMWCAKLIGRQVTHLARLVDDLLDVSRITSGKIQLRRSPLELGAVVTSAVESVRSTVADYGHVLELRVPEEPVLMEGDTTRITQLVVNLVTNAAKYTPNGGHISVRLEPQKSVACIHVADNGIGMSKRLMETAFDLFVQGDRALDRSEGGLGIGLTLVKRIAQLHAGSVTVASAGIGKGTEFTVTLPLLSTTIPVSEVRREAPAVRSRKILVVDDNQDAAHSLAALLGMSGHQVNVAHDGPEALRVAEVTTPDIVLLDLGLPTMDGYETARRMRQVPSLANTRLIAMTGYGQENHRQAAQAAGFEAHLLKPVAYDELAKVLDAAPRAKPMS